MIKAAIFDYGWTLHNPETDTLFTDAEEALKFLKKHNIKLALVSRTENVEDRHKSIKQFGLNKHFDLIKIFPINASKDFIEILNTFQVMPHETLIVGDRVKSEVVVGNKLGAVTIWLRQGKWTEQKPENNHEKPTHTIHSMKELLQLLPQLIGKNV